MKFLHDTENNCCKDPLVPSQLSSRGTVSRVDSEDFSLHVFALDWEKRQHHAEHNAHCTCHLPSHRYGRQSSESFNDDTSSSGHWKQVFPCSSQSFPWICNIQMTWRLTIAWRAHLTSQGYCLGDLCSWSRYLCTKTDGVSHMTFPCCKHTTDVSPCHCTGSSSCLCAGILWAYPMAPHALDTRLSPRKKRRSQPASG